MAAGNEANAGFRAGPLLQLPSMPSGVTTRAPRRQRGFTLLELMVVVALLAIAVGMATLALRDGNASKLDEEGARLAALLEGARARSRATGQDVRWQPTRDRPGFAFLGLPAAVTMPTQWLDERTTAEVVGAPALQLGPEPVIGAQRVRLRIEDRQLLLATDGLGPFAPIADTDTGSR